MKRKLLSALIIILFLAGASEASLMGDVVTIERQFNESILGSSPVTVGPGIEVYSWNEWLFDISGYSILMDSVSNTGYTAQDFNGFTFSGLDFGSDDEIISAVSVTGIDPGRVFFSDHSISLDFGGLGFSNTQSITIEITTSTAAPIEDQIRMLLEESLATFDPEDFIPTPAGADIDFSSFGTYDIFLENVAWEDPNILVLPVDGGFAVTVTYSNLGGDIRCERTCTYGPNCLGPDEITGDFEIESIVFTADLVEDSCQLEIDPASVSTTINNVTVNVDGLYSSLIAFWFESFIDDFKVDFETAMVDIVDTVIGEIALEPCKGDFEPDGDADGYDLNAFIVAYAAGNLAADLDESGEVNINDLAIFAAEFGRSDCCQLQ
jgi:hypothetical protein